ncbi:MAG: radical SAM protein [Planctomycetota bacterium]
MKHRAERFGGIVASDDPPMLAFVDRPFMRELGVADSPLWRDDDDSIGALSAPVEVHMACTNQCSMGCPHCYMDSRETDPDQMHTASFKAAVKRLADMGVFHVALGGGEALERPDLFELARYARQVGLVPNLTTNGALVTPEVAQKLTCFGQVNLSLDGVGELSGVFRGRNVMDTVDRAFDRLLEAGVSTGINCVVGRRNIDGLTGLFAYAARRGLGEIELLRFKPAGRGAELYPDEKLTCEQARRFYPLVQELTETHDLATKIDCSFVPMLCYHRPPKHVLEALGVCGCEAGNFLAGVQSDGRVSGCSFLPSLDLTVDELPGAWDACPEFEGYRGWTASAPAPCSSCDYLSICKGGCHAVALAQCGTTDAPDPDCPWVIEHRRAEATQPARIE